MTDTARMITANRLRDGRPVYLGTGAQWVISVRRAALARSEDDVTRLLSFAEEAARRNVIVAPYVIEVQVGDSGVVPMAWREAIRAFGPTVESELRG